VIWLTPTAAAGVAVVPPEAVKTVVATPLVRKQFPEVGSNVPPNVEEKVTPCTESFTGLPWASLAATIKVALPPSGIVVLEAVRFRLYPDPVPKPLEEEVFEEQPSMDRVPMISRLVRVIIRFIGNVSLSDKIIK
jgi:hypothetical protein